MKRMRTDRSRRGTFPKQDDAMLYVYFGHHKCASTWIREIISQVCNEAGISTLFLWNPLTPMRRSSLACHGYSGIEVNDILNFINERKIQFALFGNSWKDIVRAVSETKIKGFHVIRDPRDIIVSGYFSHKYSHPTEGMPHLAEHRNRLQNVSKEEGLLLEMDFSAQELRDMGEWSYDHPDILEIKMENLIVRPYDVFIQIFEFMGLMGWGDDFHPGYRRVINFTKRMLNRLSFRHPLLRWLRQPMPVTGELLLGRVWDHRFEKKARRRKGEEDPRSHYRKGQPGDWRNHFTEEHVAAFKEKFPGLVEKLGYSWDSSIVPSLT